MNMEQENKRKIRRTLLIVIPIIVILTIYLFWGVEGLSIASGLISVIGILLLPGILKSDSGCALFFIVVIIAAIFGSISYGLSCIEHQGPLLAEKIKHKREATLLYEQIVSKPTINLCETFVKKYYDVNQVDDVRKVWLSLLVKESERYDYFNNKTANYDNRNPICGLMKFSEINQNASLLGKVKSQISYICDSLYDVADKKSTEEAWTLYRLIVPSDYHKDSWAKIEEIKNREWNTDAKAWGMATSLNTIEAYRKYSDMYPYGAHRSQAEKKIIDLEVAAIYAGDHGTLPAMDRTWYGNGPTSHITVENDTQYTLTLRYSGVDSKKLVIPAGQTSSVDLKNGTYKIAASVSAYNVRSYAGTENLTGGSYSVSYYISSYRY